MAQPPPVPLPARLRALAARGPRSLAQTLASVVDDWRLDLSLGVETRQKVELGHIGPVLGAHADHGRAYHPTRARHLRRLFDALDLPPGLGLLDYGSGKGLVLFVAAERPFARLTGVEYAHALHAAAEANLVHVRRRRPMAPPIHLVHADAATFAVGPEHHVFYLFNPFDEVVLDAVLQQIGDSLRRWPRPAWLVLNKTDAAGKLPAGVAWTRGELRYGNAEFVWYRGG